MIVTDACTGCRNTTLDELDLTEASAKTINEEDRKRYCTDFIGKRTFLDDLIAVKHFLNQDPGILDADKKGRKQLLM